MFFTLFPYLLEKSLRDCAEIFHDGHLINEDGVCGIHDYDKVMHDLCNFYISYTFFSELG